MKIQFPKNKWFYAFVIAVAVALVAAIVAVVVGVVANRPPEYVEGDEIGVYYYDVAEGEVLLTLSGGNKFTIVGPGMNKTGAYTVEGTTITLDFVKDEDGVTTATIDGEKIALIYDNATMMFVKKNEYIVSFNVGGGSEIPAVKVVNGKTVAKPADPTKENCVFLGWYADEALTVPYAFETVAIKEDTTVYAKWAEKTFGVAEYTVDFDLGYEGAAALDAITTISGKAYGVIAPEREGYTFGGWWISMYEDASKLSYAYTENTVFTADTTLFAVWYDSSSSTKLAAPAVSVKGNAITWNAVTGASAYKLTVVGPDGNAVIDNETLGATTKAFDFTAQEAGEYKITVVAVASNEENNSDATERYYANKALDRVSQLQVVNGILVFGAVENAEKYIITVDCGNDKHTHTAFDNGASTTFYIANCPMQEGGILITVTATANGYASSTSKVFAYDLTLDEVGKVVYDAATDSFVWEAVENATNYVVTVTVGDKTFTYDNGAATTFSAATFSGDITVSVVPATKGYNSPAAATATCKKTVPAMPDGITVSGMIISWNAVDGATSYEVKIGDSVATVTTNSINLADATTITLNQGQNYSVSVKAVNEANESSAYSKPVTVGYFFMNSELTYNKNTVYWTPVLGVTEYQIRVNGGKAQKIENASSAKVVLTKEGENLIEVCYVYANEPSKWASVTVNAYAVEYDSRTVVGGAVAIEYLAVGDVMTLPNTGFTFDGYDFTGWYNTPKGAEGNGTRYEEGEIFQGNAYTVVYAEWAPKTYNVTLDTKGFDILNIENGQKEPATFGKHFTLSVPEMKDSGMYFFAGWFTGPSGTGVQITDENGQSVAGYAYPRDITVYPYYSTDALEFVLQADGTYGVKKGPAIGSVSNLIIPVTYNEIPVTTVLESAFSSCRGLVTVSIPDTIKLVGVNAFQSTYDLKEINVYVAKPGETYETFYSSDNGVLLREDMGTTYLEIVPRAMKGEYTIPESVEKILTKAFYYTEIEKIVIPNTLTSIPKYAFYYCKSLKTVEFAMGRTNPLEMESYAFYQCSAVESIALPANLNIEVADMKKVLDQFTGLKSLTIEEGGESFAAVGGMLTDKDKTTIYYCPKAYAGAVSIPQGITSIYESAFYGCKQITSVTIPIWVTNIGKQAFQNCYAIESVTFKGSRLENLTIGDYAFSYNYGLETVTFEGNGNFGEDGSKELDKGVVTIGASVFYTMTPSSTTPKTASLTKVDIQAGVNIDSVGTSAFMNQQVLIDFHVDENAILGTIGKTAFKGCLRLVSFTVPASVTSIGENAFENCTNLASVNFKEGGTSLTIANFAFMNCEKLASITIPKHLTSFNYTSFEGCDNLREIVAVDNPNYKNDENGILYGYKTVEGNPVLTELIFYPKGLAKESNGIINNLPATLTTIGGGAFAGNKYVVEVTIPKTVTSIGVGAFAECAKLSKVHFGEPEEGDVLGLVIGEEAFYACGSLSDDFALPSYTTEIGANAFRECGFTTFTIPAKVTKIQYGAFAHCKNLKNVIFECDGALEIVSGTSASKTAPKLGAFAFCDSLESITFPAGLTSIGNYTFAESHALKTVTFTPDASGAYKLKTIGTYAFRYCYAFEEIFIPNSVETVGNYAFAMKSGTPGALKKVEFELGGKAKLELGTYLFQYNPELTTLTIPARVTKIAGKAEITKSNVGTSQLPYYNMFTGCTGLAEINIAQEEGKTPIYSSLDGVLYNKDKTVLIYCPIGNVGVYENGEPTYEIIVPTSVTVVANNAFQLTEKLQTVTFAEFDKGDSNYGKQLLTLGNYKKTGTSSWSSYHTYAVIGGATSSVTTINLPSHLSTIKSGAFAIKSADDNVPVTININPDAKNIVLERNAFGLCKAPSISITSVKSIDIYLFDSCKFLTSINIGIPTSITQLPNYMLYKCTALESFTIPEHITKIGTHVFYNDEALKSITIPAKVTTLGANAFYGCKGLETVTFAKGSKITKIEGSVFYNCNELSSINLEDLALTDIGASAFYQNYKLTGIDFTKFPGLKTIGTNAFRGAALVDVDLSKTKLTTLTTAFYNVATMKTLVLPETLATLDRYAFTGVTSLEKVVITNPDFDPTTLYALAGTNAEITYPETVNKFAIDKFGVVYDPSYQQIYTAGLAKDLTGYVIPSTVITIAERAFQYAKMDKLEIPEGVSIIGAYAFFGADIPYVVFPSTVETIEKHTFWESTLQKIEFRNEHQSSLTKIDNFAFRSSALTEFTMPDTVTNIGYSLFLDCEKLEKVVFSASLKMIGSMSGTSAMGNIFGDCMALEEIVFQEGLEQINYLFGTSSIVGEQRGEHNNVKSVTIPSTVKILAKDAFALFTNLETVTIAEGSQLETVAEGAFYRCYSLKSIVLPESVTTIGTDAFSHCRSLETADLEKTQVKDIPEYTFTNTYALANLKLPAEVATIGKFAFYKAGVVDLYIPESVITIGESAFEHCTSLKTLTFSPDNKIEALGSLTEDTNIFGGATNLETIVLSNNLTTIGTRVFEESGVKVVKMANEEELSQLQAIGSYAFAQCQRLESFDHLENVIEIGDYAFLNCDLKADADAFKADLDGVISMGAMAFGFNTNLPVGYIPASVVTLGGNPYAGLDKSKLLIAEGNELAELVTDNNGVVTILDFDGVTVYGIYGLTGAYEMDASFYVYKEGAVAGNAITAITGIEDLEVVPSAMFMNCSSLVTIELADDVTSIGDFAFYGTAIESITIPATVTAIGNYAFADCDALNNVVIPAGVATLGRYCFAYCDTLSAFTFEESDSVQQLGDHFFYNCVSLTDVVVPSNPRISYDEALSYDNGNSYKGALPAYMFAGTGIVNAHIPSQVTLFYTDRLFANCENLEKLYFDFDYSSFSNSLFYAFNRTVFEGCDKFEKVAYVKEIKNGYFGLVEYISDWDIYDIHVETSITSETTKPFYTYCRIEYAPDDFNIYFDADTYTDLIEYFSVVGRDWSCNVYDKDGNQLFSHETEGRVVLVKDKNGNVIWEAPADAE